MGNDKLLVKASQFLENLVSAYGTGCPSEIESRYQELIQMVLSMVEENPEADVQIIRDSLFRQHGIQKLAEQLVYRDEKCSGFVFAYGSEQYHEVLVCGDRQQVSTSDGVAFCEDRKPMVPDSIFDLASVTKVLTCFTILRLVDKGVLDLSEKISVYDDRFQGISDLTVEQLMSFQPTLKTSRRLDLLTAEEAKDELFHISYVDEQNLRPYSDMGAMVLKYVIERVTGTKFTDVVKKELLKDIDNDFYTKIPQSSIDRVVNNNYERKVISDRYSCDMAVVPGVIHDPKARVFQQDSTNSCGHAGFFATAPAMAKLSVMMLNGSLISNENLKRIGSNHVGYRTADGKYSQYLGLLCHTKHPVPENSEVYELLSKSAFAIGGYTGNHYMLDCENHVYSFFASNRCHNRITAVINSDAVRKDSDGHILWPDGKVYCDSSVFAWDRDFLIHKAQEYTLQIRFIEFAFQEESVCPHEIIRYV